MTAIARLDIIPVRESHMADEIAAAIETFEDFDVTYEVNPMSTVIQAEDVSEIFAATSAAHEAVADERVITSLTIDDQPGREQHTEERVAAVERELGRPPRG